MTNLAKVTGITPSKIEANKFSELFEEIWDNHYESKQVFSNGEFKYKLYLEVNDRYDFDNQISESDKFYLVSLSVVKMPKSLSLKNRKSVAQCSCIDIKDLTVSDVAMYGLSALLTSFNSEDLDNDLNYLANCVSAYTGLLGFFLDRQQNAFGNTGWDFLDGKLGFNS